MDVTPFDGIPDKTCDTIYASCEPHTPIPHGTLAPFSQQGLEKLNDDLTKGHFRSTNHRNSDALKQMLLKLNCIEDVTD